MTVYKAFRNLIIALAIVGIIVAGSLIGFSAYRIYDYAQNSQYVVSKLGSTGDEVSSCRYGFGPQGVFMKAFRSFPLWTAFLGRLPKMR